MFNSILLVLFITSLILLINWIGQKLFKTIKIAIYTGTILALTGSGLLIFLATIDAEGMKQLAYAAVGTLILIAGILSWVVTFIMRRSNKRH